MKLDGSLSWFERFEEVENSLALAGMNPGPSTP